MNFLGKILKTRGNKGEVVYSSPFGAISTHAERSTVLLKSEKYEKTYEIESLRLINEVPIVKFKNVDSINDALKLVGYSIYDPHTATPEPDDRQLLDFTVKDIHGLTWGKVIGLENETINELLEIIDGEETYYVPFTESIVINIDKTDKIILIDPPAGLRDINKK